jgi:hypothetical protein
MYRVILTLALLALAQAIPADETNSAQVSVPSSPLRLDIREGKISADFKDVPIKAVLDEVRRQSGIHYQASPELTEVNVSATFEALPLDQGLTLILAPFNYMITQDDAHRRVVQLLSLKENKPSIPTSSPPAGNAEATGSDNPPQAASEPPASAEFPGAAQGGGAPELPPVTPMASPQRPDQNETPFQPLPASAPVSNTTGLVAPATGKYRELPPFTPVTNQTGPVPAK